MMIKSLAKISMSVHEIIPIIIENTIIVATMQLEKYKKNRVPRSFENEDKPNPITKRLLQIIKQECSLNDL